MASPLRIEILGRCAAYVGDRRIDPGAELVFAGLLYLGLNRGKRVARTELAELLWPDATYSVRAQRLRWLLAKLRGMGVAIEAGTASVSLRTGDVEWDLDRPEEPVASDSWRVLVGYSTDISRPYRQWVDRQRDALTVTAINFLIHKLEQAQRRAEWQRVATLSAVAHELDGLNENVAVAFAEAQFRLGATAAAIQSLERFLGMVGGDADGLRLRATVMLKRLRSDSGLAARDPRFVGRRDQLVRIDALLSDVRRGAGHSLTLLGTAGIGKTRLLDESRMIARAHGFEVVRIRFQASDLRRPLAGLSELIEHAIELPGALGCEPRRLAMLRDFMTPTAESHGRLAASALSPELIRSELLDAISDLLAAVSAERPLLVELDDIQWIGAIDAPLWAELVSMLQDQPVGWLCAGRPSADGDVGLPAPTLHIRTLDQQDASDLVDEIIVANGRSVPTDARADVLERSAGHPLLIRELLRQWIATGDIASVPSSLLRVIDRGLDGLSKPAIRVLQVAAVFGTHATIERVERVASLGRAILIDALAELEDAGMLSTDAAGAASGHVLWADGALSRLSRGVAVLIHRHAALAFEAELAARPSAPLWWEASRHWQLAGDTQKAVNALAEGAEHLALCGFPSEAADACSRAAEIANDAQEHLRMLRRAIDYLFASGRFREALAAIDRHEAVATELNPEHDPHNELELIRFDALNNDPEWFVHSFHQAMWCASNPACSISHRLRAGREAAKRASLFFPDEIAGVRAVISELEPRGFDQVWDRTRIEILYERHAGDVRRARSLAESLLVLARDEHNSRFESIALFNLAQMLAVVGEFESAQKTYGLASAVAKEHGYFSDMAAAYDYAIGLSLDVDPPDIARSRLERVRAHWLGALKHGDALLQTVMTLHEGELAAREEKYEEALKITAAVANSKDTVFPRVSTRMNTIHLAANMALRRSEIVERIALEMPRTFRCADDWLDWPATVYAEYLSRYQSPAIARDFATHFIANIRRELYPPPAKLQMLAATGEPYPPATAPITRNGSFPSATA